MGLEYITLQTMKKVAIKCSQLYIVQEDKWQLNHATES